jgi:hypothetical protein
MAFNSDYTSFGASLAGFMDVDASAIGATMIANLITVGEDRLFRESRTADMETAFSDSISSGTLALPASYLALKFAYVNTSPQVALERRSAEWIYGNYPQTTTSGIPKYIARAGSSFIFGPYPDSAYTVKGVYYKRLTSISGASLNALFVTNPDLYLFACLAEAEIIIGRDARIAIWESKYQRILADMNGMDKAEDQSGSTLQMRASVNNFVRMV